MVWIVDDDPFVRGVAEAALTKERPEIKTQGYANAQDALTAAALSTPDIVLLDLSMPDMNGYEVAPKLRAVLGKHVPIVLLTAAIVEENEPQLRAAGLSGVLAKPYDPAMFVETLKGFLDTSVS